MNRIQHSLVVLASLLSIAVVMLVGTSTATAQLSGTISTSPTVTAQMLRPPVCSTQKLAEVLAAATASAPYVYIDCSLTLAGSHVVTKQLIFEGAKASRVTLECNGATINGDIGTFNYSSSHPVDMLEIRSYYDPVTGGWVRPENVTIRNCNIKGSVRVWGMDMNADGENIRLSSRLSDHVTRVRNNAPRGIVFSQVTITGLGIRNPLYLAPGVSDFQLLYSEITGKSNSVNIYLDAESYHNTFRNNYIHAVTSERELMAVDGSSYNIILNNFFSAANHGGIYLYRNCGEAGTIRHSTPSGNTIVNNVFYYDKYDGPNPSVFVASRNGNRNYCDDDKGYPYGSSVSNYDYAQFNVVMQNQIFKRLVSDMILVGRPDVNTPNYIKYNETVAAQIGRAAGCYVSDGYQKDFIVDKEFINLFRGSNGEPVCRGYRLTCNDGALFKSSDLTCTAPTMK